MTTKRFSFLVLFLIAITSFRMAAQNPGFISKSWVSDQGNGKYRNPVLHADYSDPDVIRVGSTFYMVASSFNCVPGLPVLKSADLVNWNLIGYALTSLIPYEKYCRVQHGNGPWAPCIRFHNKEFYIYYPDPDQGIYLVKATDPAGPWSDPVLVHEGKGLIDPSPLWDDDGKAYLTFAFAGSRAGVKSVLMVSRMNPVGTKLIGVPVMVFDGSKDHPTVEGPKFYKRNGFYYLFAPAGGVKPGWQLALRSKNVFGPYEVKKVLEQGNSTTNGPHQGGWVTTPAGEDWFVHFQDKEAYGRIIHLQPMKWINNWPVIGIDEDGDGTGNPVLEYTKPNVGKTFPVVTPPEDDEFNGNTPGLQWQWQANPQITWGFPSGNLGFYRLNCIPKPEGFKNLWDVPNLMLQKFPAEEFSSTTKFTFHHHFDGEEAGFIVIGEDYQYITLKRIQGKLFVKVASCRSASKGNAEEELFSDEYSGLTVFFRITVKSGGICNFSFSSDGVKFTEAGRPFTAKPGRWIGAKIGYFALREGIINDAGGMDIDWFRINKL